MAATPITVYDRSECAGHIVTIFQAATSTGAGAAETITLDAGYPSIDLTKAHPILNIFWYETEGDDCSGSTVESNCDDEIARGTAPTTAGDFDIEGYMSFKVFITGDKNGIIMVTYWAAGTKAL